jgi:hypothetical protein
MFSSKIRSDLIEIVNFYYCKSGYPDFGEAVVVNKHRFQFYLLNWVAWLTGMPSLGIQTNAIKFGARSARTGIFLAR